MHHFIFSLKSTVIGKQEKIIKKAGSLLHKNKMKNKLKHF